MKIVQLEPSKSLHSYQGNQDDQNSIDRFRSAKGRRLTLFHLSVMLVISTMLMQPAHAWWGSSNDENGDQPSGADLGAQIFGKGASSNTDFDSTQKKISAMNVLLPISNCAECRKVQFELSASNGCYTWQNSHPQLVTMTDVQGRSLDQGRAQHSSECINRVYLEAKTLKETKSIILITAKDINSGNVLKCNTKVGQIDRLDIFTRQKQFSVNSNHHLSVVGYDDDDNIFSTMDGFQFDWSINEGNDIIKKFSSPDTGSNHNTDHFFIRSMKAGIANVGVKLEEPGYESVKLVTKKLTVVDPFIILPTEPVYILPTSEFPFTLAHLDMEADGMEHRPIKIPNTQFKWSTQDVKIGSVKDDGKFQSKVTEGEAPIIVVDQQMKNNTAEGSINVVFPYRLEVTIRDVTEIDVLKSLHAGDDFEAMQAWSIGLDLFDVSGTGSMPNPELDLEDVHILIEEHQYLIKMYLYDKDGHKITLTDNLRFKSLNLDEKFVQVVQKNKIGSEIVIKTKKIEEDKQRIHSQHKLDEIIPVPANQEKYSNFANRLTQEKELVITKPVKIQHPTNLVLLPFLPTAQEAHGSGDIWNLSAKGGSGVYIWSIIDPKVATVQGSAMVKSVNLGRTQLVCRDQKNFNNWDSIDIEVAQLNQLTWMEEQVEIKARPLAPAISTSSNEQEKTYGEVRVLSLFALDSMGRKFTNCTAVRPNYELRGETFIKSSEDYDSQDISTKYNLIKGYVADKKNDDLIIMRQKFDEQLQVTYTDDLKNQNTPELSKLLMRHNNFGICAQQEVQGENEGLARLKASFVIYEYTNGPGRVLESEFAEIAVYNPLTSMAPLYRPYMSDFYSVNQLGQEFTTFDTFYQDWKLSMQFGSSLTWKVIGGSNFWPDQVQNYRTSWTTKNLSSKIIGEDKVLEMKELSIMTTESAFNVKCLTPTDKPESYKTRITLQQASRGTRSLLRPAKHETWVDLNCEPPKSLKLTWSQEQRFENLLAEQNQRSQNRMLPRSRIVKNERTHFVLVNSRHSVRYMMLDNESQVSFNSSSVLTNVEASDTSMAEVSLLSTLVTGDEDQQKTQPAKRSYAGDVLDNVYDKRTVQFKNLTGRVYITATASHYLENFAGKKSKDAEGSGSWFGGSQSSKKVPAKDVMNGKYKSSMTGGAFKFDKEPVKSQMAIEIVRNVDVEPKFKSLYIGASQQTYRLRILHGSGSFSVSVNNTKLVDLKHKDREILLTPIELGGLQITVEDLELPQSEMAIAEVLISDIVKLQLWAPLTLIEVKDDMELTVSAYDSFMKEFDPDQYALMNFNIETETMGLRRTGGLQSTQVIDKIRNFNAYGREPGVYQLTAFTYVFYDPNKKESNQNTHPTIVSEMVRIEVFPLLEIYPSNLLITPNMRYTLQIVGGPQTTAKNQHIDGSHVEIKFDIENTKIASIDRFREVTGHEVGDAILKYEIIQLRTTQNSVQPHLSVDQHGKGVIAPLKPQSKVVSKKIIKIRVRLVTEIEIPFTHQRQIYSGSFIKMMAVLKFGEELFHHGIAPISYSWDCSEGQVLAMDIPTKQELAHNLVMTSRYIRDNTKNNDKVEFFTQFNSSAIYATGEQEGETIATVRLAIEYPAKYRQEQNWFKSSVTVKVTDRLSISVPQYSTHQEKETHMYLVPPHTMTKIETNKKSKLKLGYSQQSVFDYSTQKFKYQETNTPIIELVNDSAIRTFDKYGKVTLLVEEGGAFSDQMVMLNVKIADVYTMSTMRSYDALSLPLGSRLDLPIHLQDDHAHKFAQDISGVTVGMYLSHPKVVQVSLDQYNQTLSIQSMGSGDCNIFLFLEEHPHIFDVVRVRVSGVVQPLSPVFLNLGGEINFRLESTDHLDQSKDSQQGSKQQVVWNSGNPAVLSIEPQSGKASGKREGKADVMLSNHLNAASIVHVSKVAFGQLDQKSQLIINADNQGGQFSSTPEYRVRIKLFLDRQAEEMMPTVQFEGITLIRQKIGIQCHSDNTDFVMARGEVNELEGFFCVMSYVQGAGIRGMPRFVKITATAYGEDDNGKALYSQKVTDFEMQLISEIQVETKFMNGVELCQDYRTQSISVWSSSDFKVDFKYAAPEEGQLVLHSVTPVNEQTNEYNLTVQIPAQVSHQFDVSLVLSHQFASKPRALPLRFLASQNCKAKETSWFPNTPTISYEGKQQADSNAGWQEQPQVLAQQPQAVAINTGASWISYFIFICALILVFIFVIVQFFGIDLHDLYDLVTGRHRGQGGHNNRIAPAYGSNNRYPNQQHGRYQANVNLSGDGIRDSRAFQRQPLSRDNTFSSFGKDMSGQSAKNFNRSRTAHNQNAQNMHFDDISMNRQQTNNSAQRGNRFDSIQDSARYY